MTGFGREGRKPVLNDGPAGTQLIFMPFQKGNQLWKKRHDDYLHEGMKGKYHSLETKEKMKIAHQGQASPNKGKKLPPFSKIHRENLSYARKKQKGKLAPNWKGGKDFDKHSGFQYKKWRMRVFIRDKFTCQFCQRRGISLDAHHLRPWSRHPELRFSIDNGVTLCQECHKLAHSKYGN
ncbi:unnamed protein product [marine sediment metagenome]|uniref:HNH nuclease domain-containing protein n=1 Tax=marine sediment metagenome TaxID=412755 RepID=X1LHF1_9ZZZZ